MAGNDDYTDSYIDRPMTEGIILSRSMDGVATNVPHYVTEHSPTGYEWGYGGSGPADLALNICEAVLHHLEYEGPRVKCFGGNCFALAKAMHQDFKWQFIAPVARGGNTIPYPEVEAWVKNRLEEPEEWDRFFILDAEAV